MKCPHCNYEDKYDEHGDLPREGPFYTFPFPMEQQCDWHTYQAQILGCPSCNKMFID